MSLLYTYLFTGGILSNPPHFLLPFVPSNPPHFLYPFVICTMQSPTLSLSFFICTKHSPTLSLSFCTTGKQISFPPSCGLGSQVGEMQRKIACVWRYWVWTEPYGRAGEAFLCSLRRKLAGHHNLRPQMDWDTCTLRCELSQ
jgi:hypothetical protein